jgi:hypothetical protein
MPTKHRANAQQLAALIAEAKAKRTGKATMLEPYRTVLVRERAAGTSVRIMVESLSAMGVTISEESLRVWLVQHKSATPQKSAARPVAATPPAKPPVTGLPAVPVSGPRVARTDI